MAKAITFVSASTVREAFRNGTLDASAVLDAKGKAVPTVSLFGADGTSGKVRGRIHPAFVAAFNALDSGVQYAETKGGEKTVTVPRIKIDAKGRKRALAPVTLPVSEVRALAGISGKRGRISAASIAKAGAALVSKG